MKKVRDSFFGLIKYDKIAQVWEGKKTLSSGRSIVVYLNTQRVPTVKLLGIFISSFNATTNNEKKLKKIGAKKLRNIYHKYGWSFGKKISISSFMGRMKLKSIFLNIDGSADIEYDDGGLFQGHVIYIKVNKKGNFDEANFHG